MNEASAPWVAALRRALSLAATVGLGIGVVVADWWFVPPFTVAACWVAVELHRFENSHPHIR